MEGSGLTGDFRVRILRPALDEIRKLCRKTRDGMEIRRHLLKLRYWPDQGPVADDGSLLDLDWSYIKALAGLKIGELRIHDTISGHDNLRGIFLVGEAGVVAPLPMIWVLCVFQKKRDYFTQHELTIFKARRTLVIERFYQPDP